MDDNIKNLLKTIQQPDAIIGVLDSGVGGLSLLQPLYANASCTFVYYADTAHIPYGSKTIQEIQKLCSQAVEILRTYGATNIIIACHTASAHAFYFLQHRFPHLHFVNVIDLLINAIPQTAKNVGMIATPATVQAHVHHEKFLERYPTLNFVVQACPELAITIENEYSNSRKLTRLIKRYLTPLLRHPLDTLLLGCTHYSLIHPLIRACLPAFVTSIVSAEQSLFKEISYNPPVIIHNNKPTIIWHITGQDVSFFATVQTLFPSLIIK